MHPTRTLKLLPLLLVVVLAGASHAQTWSKYYSERDQFIVNFPGEPEIVEMDYTTETGVTIPTRIYSVEGDGSRYAIRVIDYTQIQQAHVDLCRRLEIELDRISPNQCQGREYYRDLDGAIAYEAWNIRSRGNGEVTYDAFGRVDGIAGHQLQILRPDESRSFIGLYMLDRRLYVLEGTVPGNAPPPGLFQQSLGMLDEMGRRVRHERGPDGNYRRIQVLYEYVGDEDPVTGEPISDLSPNDDGRIRDPRERTGAWVPEGQ